MNFEKLLGDKQVFQKKKKTSTVVVCSDLLCFPSLIFGIYRVIYPFFQCFEQLLWCFTRFGGSAVRVNLIHFGVQLLQIVSNFIFCIVLISVPVVPATENANEIWEAIKPEVKATIEEYFDQEDIIDEDDGPVEFQGDMDDALQW